jgi:hypothetical protein
VLGHCDLFTYGGCGGNNNNFETQNECVAHCGGPVVLGRKYNPRRSKCKLPQSKGSCQATLRRFYFDRDLGTCKLFIFGGCQGNERAGDTHATLIVCNNLWKISGNENNFETMDDCIDNCLGHPEDVLEIGGEAAGSSLVISTTTLEPGTKNSAVTGKSAIRIAMS